jgi:hypothetical protein
MNIKLEAAMGGQKEEFLFLVFLEQWQSSCRAREILL